MFKFLNTIDYNKIFVIGGSIIFQSILKDYPHYIDCIYETKVNKKYPLSITDKKYVRKLENNFENKSYYQLYEKIVNLMV